MANVRPEAEMQYEATRAGYTYSNAIALTDTITTTFNTAHTLFVGTAGNVVVDLFDGGTNITFKNIANGTLLPIRISKIYNTSTAKDIVALN